jgi:hypothetical protein
VEDMENLVEEHPRELSNNLIIFTIGLETRVEDMENLVEEHPREWVNNLMFHGIEVTQEGENFIGLANVISKIIRYSFEFC